MTEPIVKVTFTVTVEMTGAQRAAYSNRYGVGFVETEIAGRSRQTVANALEDADWLDRQGTFRVSKATFGTLEPAANWYDDWEVVTRDEEGNTVLKHRPTEGLYRILPLEES